MMDARFGGNDGHEGTLTLDGAAAALLSRAEWTVTDGSDVDGSFFSNWGHLSPPEERRSLPRLLPRSTSSTCCAASAELERPRFVLHEDDQETDEELQNEALDQGDGQDAGPDQGEGQGGAVSAHFRHIVEDILAQLDPSGPSPTLTTSTTSADEGRDGGSMSLSPPPTPTDSPARAYAMDTMDVMETHIAMDVVTTVAATDAAPAHPVSLLQGPCQWGIDLWPAAGLPDLRPGRLTPPADSGFSSLASFSSFSRSASSSASSGSLASRPDSESSSSGDVDFLYRNYGPSGPHPLMESWTAPGETAEEACSLPGRGHATPGRPFGLVDLDEIYPCSSESPCLLDKLLYQHAYEEEAEARRAAQM